MQKIIIIAVAAIAIAGAGAFIFLGDSAGNDNDNVVKGQCEVDELIFYYLDTCSWCQKVKKEGALEKLESMGVKVTRIDAAKGPINHEFTGVPTFVVNGKVYSGYKTFEELEELLECQEESQSFTVNFNGEKGDQISLANGQVVLAASTFEDGEAHFYNTELNGKTIYFFLVKDKDGVYRAAANACQVCFDSALGFHQEGNYMVCNTCGNQYPLEKIATEKGGCNPGPINPNLKVVDGKIAIRQAELEQVAEFF